MPCLSLADHTYVYVLMWQIHELHSPAMRDRHWKELLEVTEERYSSESKVKYQYANVKISTKWSVGELSG